MFAKLIFVLYLIASLCDSKIVDLISQCGKDDESCQAGLMQTFIDLFNTDAVNEIGLKKIDPFTARNMKLVVPNVLEIFISEAVIKGIKHCVVNKFKINFENTTSFLDISCKKINAKGVYDVASTSPLVKTLFAGSTIKGHGNADLTIEGIRLEVAYFFKIEQHDGEIYLKNTKKKSEILNFEIAKFHLDADNILVDNVDAAETILKFVNGNPKLVVPIFGKAISEKVLDIAKNYVGKLMNVIPTKHFISDDLTSYVKN